MKNKYTTVYIKTDQTREFGFMHHYSNQYLPDSYLADTKSLASDTSDGIEIAKAIGSKLNNTHFKHLTVYNATHTPLSSIINLNEIKDNSPNDGSDEVTLYRITMYDNHTPLYKILYHDQLRNPFIAGFRPYSERIEVETDNELEPYNPKITHEFPLNPGSLPIKKHQFYSLVIHNSIYLELLTISQSIYLEVLRKVKHHTSDTGLNLKLEAIPLKPISRFFTEQVNNEKTDNTKTYCETDDFETDGYEPETDYRETDYEPESNRSGANCIPRANYHEQDHNKVDNKENITPDHNEKDDN